MCYNRIVFHIFPHGGISPKWIYAVFCQESTVITVYLSGPVVDIDSMVNENPERNAHRLPANHKLRSNFDDMDWVS